MKKAAFIFVLAGILAACSPEVERVVNDRFPATYQFSSTGRPLAVLDLQHDILRCKVDGVRKRIFTWNTLEDFDHLFVYDYSGLDFDRN